MASAYGRSHHAQHFCACHCNTGIGARPAFACVVRRSTSPIERDHAIEVLGCFVTVSISMLVDMTRCRLVCRKSLRRDIPLPFALAYPRAHSPRHNFWKHVLQTVRAPGSIAYFMIDIFSYHIYWLASVPVMSNAFSSPLQPTIS